MGQDEQKMKCEERLTQKPNKASKKTPYSWVGVIDILVGVGAVRYGYQVVRRNNGSVSIVVLNIISFSFDLKNTTRPRVSSTPGCMKGE